MKNQGNPPIRRGTSNLEATGSTPVGRASYSPELRHFLPMQANALQSQVGTMRKRAAQYGTILSQYQAQSFADRSGADPSRVKRCVHKHFRQSQGFCRGSSGLETAGVRYSVLGNTAVLPRGEF